MRECGVVDSAAINSLFVETIFPDIHLNFPAAVEQIARRRLRLGFDFAL